MTRELRLRPAGILFYSLFIGILLTTKEGMLFISNLDSTSSQSALTALFGLGLVVFTSDAIGFVFMTIHFFFWNFFSLHYLRTLEAGYSKEWGFLSYDLKKKIVEYYKENHEKINNDNHFHRKFNQRYMNYTKDVYTSFFWQQAPQSLVVWVSRRNTAFHTSMATFTGIVLGVLGSAVLAWYSQMHFSNGTYILIASVLIFLFMLYANARNARNEGWQEIDVWLSQIFNPAAKMAVEQISNKTTHSQEGE